MSVRRLDLVNRPGGLKDRFRARCAEAKICDDCAMCSGPLHFSVTDCTYPAACGDSRLRDIFVRSGDFLLMQRHVHGVSSVLQNA